MLRKSNYYPKESEDHKNEMIIEKLLKIAAAVAPKKKIIMRKPSTSSPSSSSSQNISRQSFALFNCNNISPIPREVKYKTRISVSAIKKQSYNNRTKKSGDVVLNASVDDIWHRNKYDTYYKIIPNDGEVCPITFKPKTYYKSKEIMETLTISEDQLIKRSRTNIFSPWVNGNSGVLESIQQKQRSESNDVVSVSNVSLKSKIPPVKPPRKFVGAYTSGNTMTSIKEDGPESALAIVNRKRKSTIMNSSKLSGQLDSSLCFNNFFIANITSEQSLGLNISLKRKLSSVKSADLKKDDCSVIKKTEFLDWVTPENDSKKLTVAAVSDLNNTGDYQQETLKSVEITFTLSIWTTIWDLSKADMSICPEFKYLVDESLPLKNC